MMTQLLTAAPDLAATADTPDISDSPDHSDDGFANLLTAICAAPAPPPTLADPTEVAPTAVVTAIAAAPSPLLLLSSESITDLTSTGTDNAASLPVPTDVAATDTELLLRNLVGTDTAAAIQSEVNPTTISSGETTMTSSSAQSTAVAGTSSAASAGAVNNFPGAWWELDGDEAKAAQPLQAEAARRDLFSLASTLAETNRETRPPLIAASLSSFLAGRDGGDESGAKPTASSAASNQPAQAFNLEMASVSNAIAAGPPSAGITGQIMNPILVASDTLRQRETRTLRLNLQPEDLGQVEVQITRHAEGQFSARLTAEHDFARQALADGLGQLRAALERAGLPVERLEVNIGPGLHFDSSGQTGNQYQSHSESQPEPRLAATGLLEAEPVVTSGSAAQDRLLSLRA